jgi:hypothetical protein
VSVCRYSLTCALHWTPGRRSVCISKIICRAPVRAVVRRLRTVQKIFPIFAIVGGIYAALGIWFPRLRAHWKGSRIPCGPVSCAGFAVFFISLGLCFLVGDAIPERHRIWLFFPVMLSWIVGAIGYALDSRAYARSSPESSTPQTSRGVQPERRAWFFVAFGVFFLIMVLWIFVFHK